MPTVAVNGINIYYEETGSGTPLLFLHEFAADTRAWEPQIRLDDLSDRLAARRRDQIPATPGQASE